MANTPTVLIDKAGQLVNQDEILVDGCRFRIKVRQGSVLLRLLYSESVRWSVPYRAVFPGHSVPASEGRSTVLFFPTLDGDTFHSAVPFVITYSLGLKIMQRLKTLEGDLREEYTQLSLRCDRSRSMIWLTEQVIGSLGPTMWQLFRYDIVAGLRDFLLWHMPIPSKTQLGAASATITFTAKAAKESS